MEVGMKFTMPGKYRRRTFLQWLRGEERELEVWTCVSVSNGIVTGQADD